MTKIMLVEDSSNLNKALLLRLRHAGYKVEGARTATEARELATVFRPQLAILDVNLPDGNGFDLAAEFTEANSHLRLIFATANRDPSMQDRAKHAGAFALLSKPFDAKALLETVYHAINSVPEMARQTA